ncbi:MAG: nickel-dependent lactate racemase [Candidatus Atabeyarchaeum deiterrae]
MTHDFSIPYGNNEVSFAIPKGWHVISILSPQDPEKIRDLRSVLAKNLRNPVGSPGIAELANSKKSATIISDDKARPTPAAKLIPVILEELGRVSVKERDVTLVIGRGLHPKMTERELTGKLGKTIMERVHVEDHNADVNCVALGRTSNSVPVSINRTVADSNLKIGLGSIFPHELLGFTGGAGIIVPGVASRETINRNHMLVGKFEAKFGGIEGNLIRADAEEAARISGLNMIVNVVLNSHDEIHSVHVGDVVKAHREGVSVSTRVHGVKVREPGDVAIVSSSPNGATFGKGLKAIFAADAATKTGGTIIFVSPCNEGISSSEVFAEMLLSNPGPKFLFKLLKEGELPGESCVLYLFSLVKRRKKIILVSNRITATEAEKMGIDHAKSIEEAIEMCGKEKANVYLMPRGSITLPMT